VILRNVSCYTLHSMQ